MTVNMISKRDKDQILEYLDVDGKSEHLITEEIIKTAMEIEDKYPEYCYALEYFFDKDEPMVSKDDDPFERYEYEEYFRENGIVVFELVKESESSSNYKDEYEDYLHDLYLDAKLGMFD